MNIPVFDLHCDTALAMVGRKDGPERSLDKNDCHIDLERAGKLAGYCQCFACFTTPFMEKWMQVPASVVFQRELNILQKAMEENKDWIRQAFTAEDVERNLHNGMMSAIFTIEGPAGFDFDPARLESLYQLGFRITSLGWNEQNPLAGSNVTGGGLTDRGREYLKEAQRLGMIIDVSHISDEAFYDIMDVTQAPVIATHSNSRALCGHSRNVTVWLASTSVMILSARIRTWTLPATIFCISWRWTRRESILPLVAIWTAAMCCLPDLPGWKAIRILQTGCIAEAYLTGTFTIFSGTILWE